MDVIKELGEMKDTIASEIAEANQRIRQSGGDMNTADIEIIDKLTHSMKSLVTACAMLEAEEEGYSGEGSYYSGRGSNRGYSREYRTGGDYSRENRAGGEYGGNYSRRYSRENRNSYGYSRNNGNMMEHFRMMIDEAPDEQTRMELKQMMDKIQR